MASDMKNTNIIEKNTSSTLAKADLIFLFIFKGLTFVFRLLREQVCLINYLPFVCHVQQFYRNLPHTLEQVWILPAVREGIEFKSNLF